MNWEFLDCMPYLYAWICGLASVESRKWIQRTSPKEWLIGYLLRRICIVLLVSAILTFEIKKGKSPKEQEMGGHRCYGENQEGGIMVEMEKEEHDSTCFLYWLHWIQIYLSHHFHIYFSSCGHKVSTKKMLTVIFVGVHCHTFSL